MVNERNETDFFLSSDSTVFTLYWRRIGKKMEAAFCIFTASKKALPVFGCRKSQTEIFAVTFDQRTICQQCRGRTSLGSSSNAQAWSLSLFKYAKSLRLNVPQLSKDWTRLESEDFIFYLVKSRSQTRFEGKICVFHKLGLNWAWFS